MVNFERQCGRPQSGEGVKAHVDAFGQGAQKVSFCADVMNE